MHPKIKRVFTQHNVVMVSKYQAKPWGAVNVVLMPDGVRLLYTDHGPAAGFEVWRPIDEGNSIDDTVDALDAYLADRSPVQPVDRAIVDRVQQLMGSVAMGGIMSDATLEECVTWIATGRTVEQQRGEN